MKIEEAHQFCEGIIRANSRSFYTAYKDLPLQKRQGVFAVYAFCRKVDDAIDEHSSLSELSIYEDWLSLIQEGKELDEPVYMALKDTIERYSIDLKPFYELIEGQRMDMDFKTPSTQDELMTYCYHVASTVGLMLLPILAQKHHESLKPCAIALGYAMQLTNILRDIGEDHRMGRLYLPDLDPLSLKAIAENKVNASFIKDWEKWAKLAEGYYEEAAVSMSEFDEESRLPLIQSLVYYKAILNAVRQAKYDCLTKRQSVTNFLSCQSEIKERLRKANAHE